MLFFYPGEATTLDLKLAIQARLAVPRKEQRLTVPLDRTRGRPGTLPTVEFRFWTDLTAYPF